MRQRGRCDGPRRADRQLLETCIGVAALAAAMVAAGTGHVGLLRALRALRGRAEAEVLRGRQFLTLFCA